MNWFIHTTKVKVDSVLSASDVVSELDLSGTKEGEHDQVIGAVENDETSRLSNYE